MKLIRQIILLTLTLLVLVSSTGFAVGKHLCAGELRSISLYGLAKACPMEQPKQETPPCHDTAHEETPQKDNNCCEDETLLIDALEHTTNAKAAIHNHVPDLKFVAAFSLTLAHLLASEATPVTSYIPYSPPPLARDIPVLVQSFLL